MFQLNEFWPLELINSRKGMKRNDRLINFFCFNKFLDFYYFRLICKIFEKKNSEILENFKKSLKFYLLLLLLFSN